MWLSKSAYMNIAIGVTGKGVSDILNGPARRWQRISNSGQQHDWLSVTEVTNG